MVSRLTVALALLGTALATAQPVVAQVSPSPTPLPGEGPVDMMDNSPESRTDATAEVERYIAIPGQALAYKIGQLTILKLKAEAQAALGATFDPKAFHAVVLDTGALPMPVLERKVRDWIAAGGGMPVG